MKWTTPDELLRQLERRWDRGLLLSASVTGESIYPLRLSLRKPTSAELINQFDEVRTWIHALIEGSREKREYGYTIEWDEINHRVHGRNRVPAAVQFETQTDALRWLGKQRAVSQFVSLYQDTRRRLPGLADWMAVKPLLVLEHAQHWTAFLAVLDYFRAHPRPGMYLRQLDIPGVDTKFIEAHRGLLAELLDLILPDAFIDRDAFGIRGFNQRYGLLERPALVRFRLLDPALYIDGLSDLSVPAAQFARLNLPVRRVFITENQINGLAFPDVPQSLVIFGLGFGLERLNEVHWLSDKQIHYWGDIDTHGFAILNQLRGGLPHASSFLMDKDTLMHHRALCVQEPADRRFDGNLPNLNEAEGVLFEKLKTNQVGECLRLEQERIAYTWVEKHLDVLA